MTLAFFFFFNQFFCFLSRFFFYIFTSLAMVVFVSHSALQTSLMATPGWYVESKVSYTRSKTELVDADLLTLMHCTTN